MLVRLVCLVPLLLATAAVARAQNSSIQWLTDLDTAKQQAAAENKMILIHFWGTYCRPCLNLEHFVFTNAMIGSAVAQDFVPVKIDVEQHPTLAAEFGIRTIPHDVMLTPEGHLITKRASPNNSDGYLHMVTSVAETFRRTHPGTLNASAQLASRVPTGTEQRAYLPAGQESISREPLTLIDVVDRSRAGSNAPTGWQQADALAAARADAARAIATRTASGAEDGKRVSPIATTPPTNTGPNAPNYNALNPSALNPSALNPSAPTHSSPAPDSAWVQPVSHASNQLLQPMSEKPAPGASGKSLPSNMSRVAGNLPAPLGLEGFCPVALYQTGSRQPGNSRWGCVHRGRLYFFSSREAFERFRLTPDVFSPLLAGNDPVDYAQSGKLVPGQMDFFAFHPLEARNVLLLFRSEETRATFMQDPNRYLDEIQAAMHFADAPVIVR